MESGSLFSPQTIRKNVFHIGQLLIKIWVENCVSAIQHIGNRKRFLRWSPPPLIKLILLRTVVVLHYKHHMQIACLIKWWKAVKLLKTNYYKSSIVTYVVQICSLTSILMVCVLYVLVYCTSNGTQFFVFEILHEGLFTLKICMRIDIAKP